MSGLLTFSVLLALAAFFVGRDLRSPAQVAAGARAPTPSLITAPVRLSRAPISLVVRGTVSLGRVEAVYGPANLGGDRPVVNAMPLPLAAEAVAGDAVAAVAGHPVIVLPGRIPVYRSFAYGETGADVAELQSALGASGLSVGDDPSGTYGIGTASAVAALYRRDGYAPVTAPARIRTANGKVGLQELATVPLGEVAFLSNLPGRVVATATLGAMLKTNAPVVKIATGAAAIRTRVNANQASLIRVGDRGRALSNLSSASFRGRVASVAHARSAQAGGAPRYLITFVPLSQAAAQPLVGQNLEVRISLDTHRLAEVIVPDAAVVTNASGESYVVTVTHGRQTPLRVSVLMSYAGTTIVDPVGGTLRKGEQVVLGGGS